MKGFLEQFNIKKISGWVSFDEKELPKIYYQMNDSELKEVELKKGNRPDLVSANIEHFLFDIDGADKYLDNPLEISIFDSEKKQVLGTPKKIETNQSELNKILIGKSGWLFLDNDSNDNLAFYNEDKPLNSAVISGWREETVRRHLTADKINAKICSIIAPEKTHLYNKHLPDNFKKHESPILKRFKNDKILSHYIVPTFSRDIDDFGKEKELYYKGDSHWNFYGAYHAYLDIMSYLGLENEALKFKENFRSSKHYLAGDLITKTLGVNVELVEHISPKNTNYHCTYRNSQHTTGRVEEYLNDKASNQSRVIIFHTSSIDWMKPFLLSHFGHVKLIWNKTIDWDLVVSFNPEYIIYQTNERFLYSAPAASINTLFNENNHKLKSDYFSKIQSHLEKKIKYKVALGKKVNILIEEPNLNITKKSLIQSLLYEDDFNVTVYSHTLTKKVKGYYDSIGVNVIYGGQLENICTEYDTDVLFISDPHRFFECTPPTYDFYKKITNNILYTTLIAYIPYAFLCMKDSHAFDDIVQRYAWRYFLETEYHLNCLDKKANRVDNYLVTGHPYLDAYKNFKHDNKTERTILWCPHHNPIFYNSVNLREQDLSLRSILNTENIKIIFRPHPNLFQSLTSSTHSSSKDYKTLLTASEASEFKYFWENHHNVICDYNTPIKDLFSLSDLVITNCGGFQMESLCTGLPIINLINRGLLSSFMDMFSEQYNFADNVEDMMTLIHMFLKGDIKGVNLNDVLKLLPEIGSAGNNIAINIKSSLLDGI